MITTNVDVSAFDELKGKVLTLAQTDSLLREIAGTMLSETANRIHEEGKKADGADIGQYSDSYLKQRAKKSLGSSSRVILFYSGQMQRDYKVIPISKTEYGLGFSNTVNSDKATYMEEGTTSASVKEHQRTRKGKKYNVKSYTRKGWQGFGKIYQLTEEELQKVRDIIAEYIQTKLK